MTALQKTLAIAAALACLATLAPPFALGATGSVRVWDFWPVAVFLIVALAALAWFRRGMPPAVSGTLAIAGAIILLTTLRAITLGDWGFWLLLVAVWCFAWLFAERLAADIARGDATRRAGFLIPLLFGASILVLWEAVTIGAGVERVLLPPPSAIWQRLISSVSLLAADFQQTFLKAVLIGYALGCGSAFLVAIAIDRSPFLKRGLLPLGSFISALPLIGIAPIMVMWFGFDWPSKAAVVVIMTFFPMLVNTIAGLNASGQMERDMMRTYAAGYWQTLFKLRLPAAAPFIFNALKINSTLALIGAIVSEFFGTPIVGMGFRISSEIGKLRVDMVWAEIAVAAVAGSAFYGVVVLIERAVTFWHPSVRGGRA